MKIQYTLLLVLFCGLASAQNINDVLRYGTEGTQGTARFQAMGGAFGALGGDFSALNINPAGSAVFNNSLMTLSGSYYGRENGANYFGSLATANRNEVDMNQIGGAFVFNNTNPNSDWKKFTLAFNYDMVRNFDNEIFAAGNSTQGVDNYFLNFAQGQRLGPLFVQDGEFIEEAYLDIGSAPNLGFGTQQAFLGFQSGLIEPVDFDDDDNTAYFSNATYNSVNQEYLRTTSGYNSKFTVNAASQYQDRLYLGASMNFHSILYSRYDEFTENGYDASSAIQRTTFDNLLRTEGSAFSFSLGAIAKLNEAVRLGASYQSPTWYRLTDDLSQRIFTDSPVKNEDLSFINFDVINLFEAYTIKIPSKLNGSLAIVFGQNGLLSLDYGYQDFSQAELRPATDGDFQTVNTQIANELGAVSSFRLGGEYRIEQFSLRGGYRYEQSPYANSNAIDDLTGISAGLGYNFGGSRLDLAISRTEQDRNERFFDTGITTPAVINARNTNVTLSYTLNF